MLVDDFEDPGGPTISMLKHVLGSGSMFFLVIGSSQFISMRFKFGGLSVLVTENIAYY